MLYFIDPQIIESAEAPAFWGLTAFIVIAGLAALYAFANYLKQVRLIEDTPTSKIRSAAQGFVELEGITKHLNPDSPMFSPLSDTPCVWYEFKIEKKIRTGKDSTTWRTIQSGRSSHPITLDDTTGVCLLKPAKAKIHSHQDNTWYGTSRHPSKLSVDRKDSLLQFGNYRYSEEFISAESPIYALGHFKTTRASDNFTREKAISDIIREWKQDYASMLQRFDRNGDGTLDEKEWKLVRLAASLEAENLEAHLAEQADVHVMEKPSSKLPYLISTSDQKEFTQKLKWYYRIALVLALAALYVGSWIIYIRLTH